MKNSRSARDVWKEFQTEDKGTLGLRSRINERTIENAENNLFNYKQKRTEFIKIISS
jgi:hypothetical protein